MSEFRKNSGFGGNRDGGFKKKSFGGPRFGRPNFGDRGGFNRGGDRGEMFTATCAKCNKECQVPFRPNGSKPVYCNDCFGANRDNGDRPARDNRESRGNFNDAPKREFNAAPQAKPQFDTRVIDDLKQQLSAVNAKLDNVLSLLANTKAPAKTATVSAAPAEVSEKSEAAAKPAKVEKEEKVAKTVKAAKAKPAKKGKK